MDRHHAKSLATVIRIGQCWHVARGTEPGRVDHVHFKPFEDKAMACALRARIPRIAKVRPGRLLNPDWMVKAGRYFLNCRYFSGFWHVVALTREGVEYIHEREWEYESDARSFVLGVIEAAEKGATLDLAHHWRCHPVSAYRLPISAALLTLRRIGEGWHVAATTREGRDRLLHFKRFEDKSAASALLGKITRALSCGRRLDRARWSPRTVTLTGYLGQDREIRTTKTTTEVVPGRHVSTRFHEYTTEPYEIKRGGREFIVLSLAVNEWTGNGSRTTWHRLVVWNPYRGAMHAARLCRKGFKVQVTGRREEFVTAEGRRISQVIVEDLRILKWKAPELP